VVLAGRGRFSIDGELVEVFEGSIVRMAPEAVRSFRTTGEEPAYLLVIQTRADSRLEGGTTDGEGVEGTPFWQS
jgi:mannose-6-phosphate isomerase-like protein (cupin superfamily)